jgi:hypothetical protein
MVGGVQRDGFAVVIDRDIGPTAERESDALGGTAAAGKAVDDLRPVALVA